VGGKPQNSLTNLFQLLKVAFIELPSALTLISSSEFFEPEDGGDKFLRNVRRLSKDSTASYPRRQNFFTATAVGTSNF
jgi:hypothetical protein